MFFNYFLLYLGKEGKSIYRKHFPVFLNTELIFIVYFQFLNYKILQGTKNKQNISIHHSKFTFCQLQLYLERGKALLVQLLSLFYPLLVPFPETVIILKLICILSVHIFIFLLNRYTYCFLSFILLLESDAFLF